jgi:threonine/homoserine/homoserine lactone efflux protein
MGDVIGEFLPYAVGVAVSPIPIAAVLLMLVTKKARTNGPLFALGWLAGLTAAGVIVLLIPGLEPSQGEPSTAAGVVKGILGVLLLGVGVKAWTNRPVGGDVADPPGWMHKIDGFNGPKSLGMGFLLSALNPKNLLLTVGGAATISAAALGTSEQYVALVVFVVVASLTILVPVFLYLILGEKAEQVMTNTKDWLIQNNQTVMAVLLLVLSISLIGDAIEILF